MTIHVQWDDPEQTILCWEFPEDWQIDDFAEAEAISVEMVMQSARPFHLVIHIRGKDTKLPPAALSQFIRAMTNASPLQQSMVIVGAGLFTEKLMNTIRAMKIPNSDKHKLLFAEDMPQARRRIKQQTSV
ncbi:MAG: hypothetical protein OHK0046_23420 [Anaerolineae bacterium]